MAPAAQTSLGGTAGYLSIHAKLVQQTRRLGFSEEEKWTWMSLLTRAFMPQVVKFLLKHGGINSQHFTCTFATFFVSDMSPQEFSMYLFPVPWSACTRAHDNLVCCHKRFY